MPRSPDQLFDLTRPQTDEELGTEVPFSKECNINQLVKRKPRRQIERRERAANRTNGRRIIVPNTKNHYNVSEVMNTNQKMVLRNEHHSYQEVKFVIHKIQKMEIQSNIDKAVDG